MKAALILVDIQQGFIDHPDLYPKKSEFLLSALDALKVSREYALNIFHIRTEIENISQKMPHWTSQQAKKYLNGGVATKNPKGLEILGSEILYKKTSLAHFKTLFLKMGLRNQKWIRFLSLVYTLTHA
jgi:hypothetical protein